MVKIYCTPFLSITIEPNKIYLYFYLFILYILHYILIINYYFYYRGIKVMSKKCIYVLEDWTEYLSNRVLRLWQIKACVRA